MGVRSLALVLAVAVLTASGAVWFAARSPSGLGSPTSRSDLRSSEAVEFESSGAGTVEPALVAPSPAPHDAQRAVIEMPAADRPGSGPMATPDRPRAGEALLQLEVVALETGEPIPEVDVWLWTDEEVELATSAQGDPSCGLEGDDVVTDDAGRAELIVVAGRAYGVLTHAPSGKADSSDLETAIEPLRDGEQRGVRLTLPTAWTRVWYGRAVDAESGLPIGGAQVEILIPDHDEPVEALPVLARGTTDGAGHVSIRLPAWEIAAARCTAPGYHWSGCLVRAAADSFEDAAVVELRRPAALAARVLDAAGEPAPDVEVRLRAQGFDLLRDVGGPKVEWSARPGANGICEFPELPAAVELAVEIRRGTRVLSRPPGLIQERKLVPGERRWVEWRLQRGCALTGVVRDREGEPMGGVPLVLTKLSYPAELMELIGLGSIQTAYIAEQEFWAAFTSDARGRIVLDDVPAGSWGLSPAEEAEDLPRVMLHFAIDSQQASKEVELRLDRGLTISGTVLDPEGKPVFEAGVRCLGTAPGHRDVQAYGSCDTDGTFSVGPLLQGDYLVQATPSSDHPLHARSEETLVAAGAAEVVLRLRWGGIVSGELADASTGRPVSAEQVRLHPAGTTMGGGAWIDQSFGSSEGFEIERVLPGSYDLVARASDGRIGVLRAIQVAERQRLDGLVIRVHQGASVKVRTQSPPGVFVRSEVTWEGLPIQSGWTQPWTLTVPPGAIEVRWLRIGADLVETLVHHERGTASVADELSFSYEHRE